MTEVKSGDVVRIHYTGTLADGTVFGTSQGQQPLEFTVGSGQIIPGLDAKVSGMAVGETGKVTIPADQAYGPRDEHKVQVLPRNSIPDTIELSVGARLQAQTQDGQMIELTVTDFDDTQITVDANHPLAGRDLTFEVEVVEIVGG